MVLNNRLRAWGQAFWRWLSASDVASHAPSPPPAAASDLMQGGVVSAEVGTHLGHDAESLLMVETDGAGLASIKNRIPTPTGRYTYSPVGGCRFCGAPIAPEDGIALCSRRGCGKGLCKKCSHEFKTDPTPAEPTIVLCPEHAEIFRWRWNIEDDQP